MDSPKPLLGLLRRLWRHIPRRRRVQLTLLLALNTAASLAEVLTLGAVLPFLAALTVPEKLFSIRLVQVFAGHFGYGQPQQLILPLTAAFACAVIVAGVMRLLLLWSQIRLSYSIGSDIGIEIYRRTLFQPYPVHVRRNSSEVIAGISQKARGVISTTIQPLLTLAGSCLLLAAIFLALMAIDYVIAISSLAGFSLIYAGLSAFVKRHLSANSRVISSESTKVIKSLQEGLGGIRDVLIDGCQAVYCDFYRKADANLRRAQANNIFISQSPRYAVEALGMLLICTVAYFSVSSVAGAGLTIPVLGTLALGAQRMLPNLQQIYSAWASLRGGHASLVDVLDMLDQPLPESTDESPAGSIAFDTGIELKNVGFKYTDSSPFVLRGLNLQVTKGARVGFIGTTGSGKSSLLDIIMGLLVPTEGQVRIDAITLDARNTRGWQRHVAHVPQAIFLSDATIEENIAFGSRPQDIDHVRVREAAKKAQIAEMIDELPEGYKTIIGERGIRLSGGQRQRIGIARALYKRASVLILDEATSALDNQTETAVMDSVRALSDELTILIVAHRLTTLKCCDMVVELSAGVVSRIGSYEEIIAH
jgi:ATP-binding cassette, subfamily B, bacterial PglK